jgi:hypothetical protein
MEVHAHSHTARKKWTHYFWEFLMLFLAVFCGFLAEYQLEHKIEKDRAKEFAKLLKNDLVADTVSLANFIQKLKEESVKREQASKLFEKDLEDISIGDLRWADTTNFILEFFISKNPTLEQMKHAGQLRYFRNPELTSAIAHYDWSVKHYLETKLNIQGIHGGLSSEYILKSLIAREVFLKKSAEKHDSLLAIKEGFNFDSWLESRTIAGVKLFLDNYLLEQVYPDLKKQATQIIELLNKLYRIK